MDLVARYADRNQLREFVFTATVCRPSATEAGHRLADLCLDTGATRTCIDRAYALTELELLVDPNLPKVILQGAELDGAFVAMTLLGSPGNPNISCDFVTRIFPVWLLPDCKLTYGQLLVLGMSYLRDFDLHYAPSGDGAFLSVVRH